MPSYTENKWWFGWDVKWISDTFGVGINMNVSLRGTDYIQKRSDGILNNAYLSTLWAQCHLPSASEFAFSFIAFM